MVPANSFLPGNQFQCILFVHTSKCQVCTVRTLQLQTAVEILSANLYLSCYTKIIITTDKCQKYISKLHPPDHRGKNARILALPILHWFYNARNLQDAMPREAGDYRKKEDTGEPHPLTASKLQPVRVGASPPQQKTPRESGGLNGQRICQAFQAATHTEVQGKAFVV